MTYLDGVELVNSRPEVVRVSPERDFQQRQEPVHAGEQTLRPDGRETDTGLKTLEARSSRLRAVGREASYVLAAVCLEGIPSNTMTLSAR